MAETPERAPDYLDDEGPWWKCPGCGREWDAPIGGDGEPPCFCSLEPGLPSFDDVLATLPVTRQAAIRATLAEQQGRVRRSLAATCGLPDGWTACEVDGVTHALHVPCKTAFLVPLEHQCAAAVPLSRRQPMAETTQYGLPPDESSSRDAVVEMLTAQLVAVGALAYEAGETTTFDLRDEAAIRGLARYLTARDSGGRDGDAGERKRVFWERLGCVLHAAAPSSHETTDD